MPRIEQLQRKLLLVLKVLGLSGVPFLTGVYFKQTWGFFVLFFFLAKDVEVFIAQRSREAFLSSSDLHVGAKNSEGFGGEVPPRENTMTFTVLSP